MNKTTLYLTRHGQTEWNLQNRMQGHQDSPLTASGVVQAGWLRERLETVNFDTIYSSTSPRALSTARIIQGDRSGDIQALDALKEINMGPWEGQQIDDIQKNDAEQYRNFWQAPHLYQPSGTGETYTDLMNRAIPAIKDIFTQNKGGHVLVVTHRITLRAIMGYYLDKTLHELVELPDILSTSLCKISMKADHPCVELYGDTSHYKE